MGSVVGLGHCLLVDRGSDLIPEGQHLVFSKYFLMMWAYIAAWRVFLELAGQAAGETCPGVAVSKTVGAGRGP